MLKNKAFNAAVPDSCPILKRLENAQTVPQDPDIPMSGNVHFFVTKSDLGCAILKPSEKGTKLVLRR